MGRAGGASAHWSDAGAQAHGPGVGADRGDMREESTSAVLGGGGQPLRERVHNPSHRLEVALVGKHIDLHDAYPSVSEAIRHAGFTCDARVDIRWIASGTCETPEGAQRALAGVDAVVVPGGFGVRGEGAGDARSRGHADGGAVRVRHRGRRPGRHDAPRCLPGGPGRGIAGRSGLRSQAGHRKA